MIHWIIFTLCLLQLVSSNEYEFTVEVPPGKFQCYFQTIDNTKQKAMEVNYQVIDGGDLNVNFMLLLGANMLVQDRMKTDGSHRIELQTAGDYQICFDNSFSYQARKVVFFEIYLYDANGNIDEGYLENVGLKASEERMKELGVSVQSFHSATNSIRTTLNKIEYYQALMRAQESRDRAIMGANYDRVTFWSVLHTIVMIGVGAVQVYMIRCLFEDNKVGRLLRHPRD